jgi:Domain of unknown function (DUF5011)
MKKILSIISISALVLFAACKKSDVKIEGDQVGISTVTHYPVFQMTGGNAVSVVKGTSFVDPGIKATVNGAPVPVTTSGTLNTNVVGLYTLTYTATNSQGFSATSTRTVVVIPSAEVPGTDLSGTYVPIGGAPSNATVTKVAPGLYYMTNAWGGGSTVVIPVYFISTDGKSVNIPMQNVGGVGRVDTPNPGTYVNGLITWDVVREDFPGGPLLRTKQWQKQ